MPAMSTKYPVIFQNIRPEILIFKFMEHIWQCMSHIYI